MYLLRSSVPWWDLRVFYREIIPIFIFLEATWLNWYNIIFNFSHLLCNQLILDPCKDKISISWCLFPDSITHTHKHTHANRFHTLTPHLKDRCFPLPRLLQISLISLLSRQTHQTGITFLKCFMNIHVFSYLGRLKGTISHVEIIFDAVDVFCTIKIHSRASQFPSCGCQLLLLPGLCILTSSVLQSIHGRASRACHLLLDFVHRRKKGGPHRANFFW